MLTMAYKTVLVRLMSAKTKTKKSYRNSELYAAVNQDQHRPCSDDQESIDRTLFFLA